MPPSLATTISDGQLTNFLFNAGTFDPTDTNEVRQVADAAGVLINVVTARGAAGFNIPSLLSVFAGAPYLHNGKAQTLGEVLDNQTHRTAGRPGGTDILAAATDRRALVRFLESIDGDTPPFP